MKKSILFLLLIIGGTISLFSQQNTGDETKKWDTGATISFNSSQSAFVNWAAGGQNSLTLNALLNAKANYKKDKLNWDNRLDIGYGQIKQGAKSLFKSDDKLEINSKAGYQLKENTLLSGLVNLKSQLTPGYANPDDPTLLSDLFSPIYAVAAIGLDLKPAEGWSLFLAPVSGKITYVTNEELVKLGLFGLEAGEKSRLELGAYLRTEWSKKLNDNANFTTKLDLFSNYLDHPERVDVNWDFLIQAKIYKSLSLSLNTQLIYDHDLEIGKDTTGDGSLDDFGPRIQFKELFGIGLSWTI